MSWFVVVRLMVMDGLMISGEVESIDGVSAQETFSLDHERDSPMEVIHEVQAKPKPSPS